LNASGDAVVLYCVTVPGEGAAGGAALPPMRIISKPTENQRENR